ncbi:hypothetical protein EDC65_2262 [Stella humosa]|uniref:Uncharacterized protein n=1 Tax=Stella humosa TaxID=94 RepID=A0A3N1M9V1_9PROT|nr:hypothetical protein [Stella humosa]ROQ00463.1 hypothetical protein EDC65_2262 [Stella humosa]BBK30292.1 hypothetical protein STHU_09260 [Stella humosa]
MNLRILKKLSRRAAPLLPHLTDHRQQFRAERGENYTGLLITARKHFERTRSVHAEVWRQREFKTPARDGNGWIFHAPPDHPRKGTIMVGAMSGGEESEWSEETAWEALREIVFWHYCEWDPGTDNLVPLRCLRSPSDIFRAADEMLVAGEVSRLEWLASRSPAT